MCEWGTETVLNITVPAHLSHTGQAYRKLVGIDSCIAPLVKALNDVGLMTESSCCGHGKGPATIALPDDQWLIVLPKDEAFKLLDSFKT